MGEGRTDEPRRDKRLTVQQAAARLGISEGAVRNRIKRGTLRADRVAGRVYVLLSGAASRDESIDESLLVAVLRKQLAAERQAHAEARRIIAGLVERIPAIEAPSETSKAHEAAEEQQGRVVRAPLRYGRGSGGRAEAVVEESIQIDRRSMQNEQTVQDATRLLVAFSTNHSEARMVSPYRPDRPFSPSWADAEQAGLDRGRRDTAIKWLVDKNMLERNEEAENLLGTGEGFHSEYGLVFRITGSGRELLEEGRERRQA